MHMQCLIGLLVSPVPSRGARPVLFETTRLVSSDDGVSVYSVCLECFVVLSDDTQLDHTLGVCGRPFSHSS